MSWSDFQADSALECDVLRRALPVVPPASVFARATYDPEVTGTAIGIGVADSLGATPEGCVETLALHPLLVGAAWKVLDLLYEEALEQHGLPPDRGREYTIKGKQKACAPRYG